MISFTAHQGRVASLAFSPDGRHLASSGNDGRLHVWDAGGRAVLDLPSGRDFSVVRYSPDGRLLAWAGRGVRVWGLGAPSAPVLQTGDQARCCCFTADGSALLVQGNDGSLRSWGTADWKMTPA